MAVLALLTFGLAYLSWRFVEQPFRRKSFKLSASRGRLFAFAIVGSAAFVGIGLNGFTSNGYPWRMPVEVQTQLDRGAERNPLIERCFFSTGDVIPAHPIEACMEFAPDGQIDVLFIGDSHSDAISYQAQQVLAAEGISS